MVYHGTWVEQLAGLLQHEQLQLSKPKVSPCRRWWSARAGSLPETPQKRMVWQVKMHRFLQVGETTSWDIFGGDTFVIAGFFMCWLKNFFQLLHQGTTIRWVESHHRWDFVAMRVIHTSILMDVKKPRFEMKKGVFIQFPTFHLGNPLSFNRKKITKTIKKHLINNQMNQINPT